MKTFEFLVKFHLNMFPVINWQYGSIGSDTGNKPLSEPMKVCFTDTYMHHLALMS